jgi:hypothetical protein
MSNIVHDELLALATEFAALRQSDNKRSFPEITWKKAIALTQQIPIDQVCEAIKISPTYLRKKASAFTRSNSEVTFIELIPQKPESSLYIKINIESPSGHKMMIDGINTASIAPILSVFLKEGGASCCK